MFTEDDQDSNQESVEKDRELIASIMPMTKKAIYKLRDMEVNNMGIVELKRKQSQEARGEKEKEYSQELTSKVRENQADQNFIKNSLDELRQEVKNAREKFPDEPECRVIIGIYSALMIKFREVLREFQEAQLDYKNTTQDNIRRRIKIMKPEADEEEVTELVNNPEATSKLFKELFTGPGHAKITNAVDDIERKYQDILKLEKGVEEVYQLFLDLGTLISAQGEMLDSILSNMHEAKNYVKEGNKHLEKAKVVHKKTRTKM